MISTSFHSIALCLCARCSGKVGKRDVSCIKSTHFRGKMQCGDTTLVCEPCKQITSLALWIRRPPRERKIRGSNPAGAGIFPD